MRKKQFKTLEQCYGYIRAKRFNDDVVATNILKTSDPAEVKRLGYEVRGFRASEWNNVKEDIMLKLLRIKFCRGNVSAEKLKATETKQLPSPEKTCSSLMDFRTCTRMFWIQQSGARTFPLFYLV